MYIFRDQKDGDCRIVKDIVCFHAANFQQIVEKLMLDLHEPPTTQVPYYSNNRWIVIVQGENGTYLTLPVYKMKHNTAVE